MCINNFTSLNMCIVNLSTHNHLKSKWFWHQHNKLYNEIKLLSCKQIIKKFHIFYFFLISNCTLIYGCRWTPTCIWFYAKIFFVSVVVLFAIYHFSPGWCKWNEDNKTNTLFPRVNCYFLLMGINIILLPADAWENRKKSRFWTRNIQINKTSYKPKNTETIINFNDS